MAIPPPANILPAPDPVDREWVPLLSEPFAGAWSESAALEAPGHGAMRRRLLERAARSRAASSTMFTTRAARQPVEILASGATARTLYRAPEGRARRPGEPVRARLIELEPGARWAGPRPALHREWLVLRGQARLGDHSLRERDYRVVPAGTEEVPLSTDAGTLLFLRESALPGDSTGPAVTVRDAEAGWPEYAPGIRRRVLWQHGGQAALLYCAEAGASVPAHAHGHDEECLMVGGELFLDDILLREGDYQLAPAGSGHRVTQTDTGVVIYAHGDLDLQFIA